VSQGLKPAGLARATLLGKVPGHSAGRRRDSPQEGSDCRPRMMRRPQDLEGASYEDAHRGAPVLCNGLLRDSCREKSTGTRFDPDKLFKDLAARSTCQCSSGFYHEKGHQGHQMLRREARRPYGHNFAWHRADLWPDRAEGTGVPPKVLKSMGVQSLRGTPGLKSKNHRAGAPALWPSKSPLAVRSRCPSESLNSARKKHVQLGTYLHRHREHLLLGLIREGEGVARTGAGKLGG